jgi:acetyl-CoA acyltransferase
MRAEIEQRAGIDAVDIYGLSEVMGPGVASECIESKDGPVIWEDHFYPEIIDPETGEVLPDGEEGELVFTSLSKEALPIIRYRTRDLTRLLPPTSRSMRRIGKITGRSDDMLIIRGVNVFPTQIEELICKMPKLAPQYQLVVSRDGHLDKLEVLAELRPRRPPASGSAGARAATAHQDQRRRQHQGHAAAAQRHRTHADRQGAPRDRPAPEKLRRQCERSFICDAIRTPFGRYGGALSGVRADDLAALPIAALMARNPGVDWSRVDDVYYGCANQAGEDNRNVARMAALLAGLPVEVPGSTINRLCGSSLDAVGMAARAIKSGEAQLMIAGGVESMSRALRDGQGRQRLLAQRENRRHHHRLALRQSADEGAVRHRLHAGDGGERGAGIWHQPRRPGCVRAAQPAALGRRARGRRVPRRDRAGDAAQRKGEPKIVDSDEHPRPDTTLEMLAKLKGVVRPDGTVTAGNASGVNDGACAMLLASAAAAEQYGLRKRARVLGMATAAGAAHHGLRPVAGVEEGAGADWA